MSFRLENNRDALYQWDSEQRLVIEDNSITHIHYCNRTDDEALVVEVYKDARTLNRVADIPNILLQDVWNICVYAYADGRYTKQSKIFKVIKRSKPADYIYTETEILRWEALETELRAEMEALEERVIETMNATTEGIMSGVSHQMTLYANTLIGAVSGNDAVAAKDVSPVSHSVEITATPNAELELYGKNILNLGSIKGKTATLNGGTLTCGEDGGITGSGTPTGAVAFTIKSPAKIPKGAKATFSGFGDFVNMAAVIYLRNASGSSLGSFSVLPNKKSIVIDTSTYPDYEYITIEIKRNANNTPMSGTIYLQLEIGTTATDYEEYKELRHIYIHGSGEAVVEMSEPFTLMGEGLITIKYNRDTNAVIKQLTQAIISLGGNV